MSALAVLLLVACRSPMPKEPVISEVEITGADSIDSDSAKAGLASQESSKFLGIWDGVAFEYERYDPDVFRQDLKRLERYMHAEGQLEAKVVAARVVKLDKNRIKLQIEIAESTPVIVSGISLDGLVDVKLGAAAKTISGFSLKPGDVLQESLYEKTKEELRSDLANQGYAYCQVVGTVRIDLLTHQAEVIFHITPGIPAKMGAIEITGLDEVPEDVVRDNFLVTEGDPYSEEELEDARRALVNLGVFATVDLVADKSNINNESVPIKITLKESKLRSWKAGAGTRIDTLGWYAHGVVGWESKNFLGGMRQLRIEAKPGLVFYPTKITDLSSAPDRTLVQGKFDSTLRQPSFIEGRTAAIFGLNSAVFPLLYTESQTCPTKDGSPCEPVIGFTELGGSFALERLFFKHRLLVSPSYSFQAELPFDYHPLSIATPPGVPYADPSLLHDVYVSVIGLTTILDLRNDRNSPTKGAFFSNILQWAGPGTSGAYDSSFVSDFRWQPEVRLYRPLSKRVTLAARFTYGTAFNTNYGLSLDPDNTLTQEEKSIDQQKLLFRAFYSGGANSNRGYPIRGVGPRGTISYLDPDCTSSTSDCLRPLGGLAVWEASVDVRFRVVGDLAMSVFVDTSDVLANSWTFSNDGYFAPHLSVGVGIRYLTPVGPIRLEAGYRVPGLQIIGRAPTAEESPDLMFGSVPMAIHLAIGEAY